jgi:hypothetical protein
LPGASAEAGEASFFFSLHAPPDQYPLQKKKEEKKRRKRKEKKKRKQSTKKKKKGEFRAGLYPLGIESRNTAHHSINVLV